MLCLDKNFDADPLPQDTRSFIVFFFLQIRMDETQEREATQLADKLQHELEILTACQTKSKVSGDQQRARERRELEERVEVLYP